MKRFASLLAFLALPIVALVPSAQVFADSPGQLTNAVTNYEVKNVTKNGSYSQSTSAACGETVKYSVYLANSEFGLLKNLTVKTDLGSGNISASAINAAGATTSVAGKVTVTLSNGGTLSYISGSTVRITSDGKTTTNLPDGIISGGVNAGELNGSTQTFVQFQAKVNCVTPPKDIKVCRLSDKTIITIKENEFDATKHSKNLDDCKVEEKKITVCRLSDKQIVIIKESEFDSSKHSKNLNDCKTVEEGKLKVCRLSDKTVVTIKESEFDSSKYSKDLNDCAEEETPTEIPSTGPAELIGSLAGTSALGYGAYTYAASRRALRNSRK